MMGLKNRVLRNLPRAPFLEPITCPNCQEEIDESKFVVKSSDDDVD